MIGPLLDSGAEIHEIYALGFLKIDDNKKFDCNNSQHYTVVRKTTIDMSHSVSCITTIQLLQFEPFFC